MKALTLKHPWPFAIVALGKRLENRGWLPSPSQLREGDWFAVHGGVMPRSRTDLDGVNALTKRLIEQHREQAEAWRDRRGMGHVALRDTIRTGVVAVARYGGFVNVTSAAGDPWFCGPMAWRLNDLIELPEPVACRGAQGLWELPADVALLVEEQIRLAGAAA